MLMPLKFYSCATATNGKNNESLIMQATRVDQILPEVIDAII